MAGKTNMFQTVKELDSKIGKYTHEKSAETRGRVVNAQTGQVGIIVSYDVDNPEKSGKGKGHMVKWQKTGDMNWYSKSSLENANSPVKTMPPDLMDFVVTYATY